MNSKRLTLSFNIAAFLNLDEAIEFAVNHIPFVPQTMTSSKSFIEYHKFDKVKMQQQLRQNQDKVFAIADDYYSFADEKNKVSYFRDESLNLIAFYFSLENFESDWLHSICVEANNRGLFLGFLNDSEKSLWQSEILIDNFIYEGKSYDNLKTIWHPVLSPIFDCKIIDIFLNPGHSKMTYTTWLMAAPQMWFGKAAWQYFNKADILTFTKAIKIEEINDQLLYVHLFDVDSADYEGDEILKLQSEFRHVSKMNDIEMKLDKIHESHIPVETKPVIMTVNIIDIGGSQNN